MVCNHIWAGGSTTGCGRSTCVVCGERIHEKIPCSHLVGKVVVTGKFQESCRGCDLSMLPKGR